MRDGLKRVGSGVCASSACFPRHDMIVKLNETDRRTKHTLMPDKQAKALETKRLKTDNPKQKGWFA